MERDLTTRRLIAKQLVATAFAKPWQFDVQIATAPKGFSLFAKDVTFGPWELETETTKAGLLTITHPIGATPTTITLTMRDHEDERNYKWFESAIQKVYAKGSGGKNNGAFNLPSAYVLDINIINIITGTSTFNDKVIPQKMGDITLSVDAEGFKEFPLMFVQYRTL